MTDPSNLWEQAAQCYRELGLTADEARCYERGGLFRRAGDLYKELGRLYDAATMYERGHHELEAGWLLAHELGDAPAAHACLARTADVDVAATDSGQITHRLLGRLIEARCDLIENRPGDGVLAVIAETQEALAGDAKLTDPRILGWAVEIAAAMRRFDQVALLFAAAVRGRRYRAAEHWSEWMLTRFGVPIVVPSSQGV